MSVKAALHFKVYLEQGDVSPVHLRDTSRAKWKCTTSKELQHKCAFSFDGTWYASKRMTLQNIRNSFSLSTPLLCLCPPHVWYMTEVVLYLSSPFYILHRPKPLMEKGGRQSQHSSLHLTINTTKPLEVSVKREMNSDCFLLIS